MKTISDRIYEILNAQTEAIRTLQKQTQSETTLDLLDLILNGCENIETLTQAIVVLDSESREPN